MNYAVDGEKQDAAVVAGNSCSKKLSSKRKASVSLPTPVVPAPRTWSPTATSLCEICASTRQSRVSQ